MSESDYETAYKDLIQRLGGAIDGVNHAADMGSSSAMEGVEQWDRTQKIVDDNADEHDVEGIWDLPTGYDPKNDDE